MEDTDQIKVVVRVRPLIQREQQIGQDVRWTVKDEKTISQLDQPNLPPYVFDKIYDHDCSTWKLYSGDIAPIVDAAMHGYHGTVFAYGQSGSGKTYTMSGNKMTPGIITEAVRDIFDFIEKKPGHEFLMRASYMEIYNEKIYDLFKKEDKLIKLQETPDHQINVVGLEELLVSTCDQIIQLFIRGEAHRTFAATKQNDRSSRSHCIFRIIIESRKQNKENDAAVMVSHLNFVDLAGSERAAENSGDRFREGCSINKSLFSLSNVISKLSEGVSNQFINYRDSKLTRILQNALGGNSKTVIVATINPTVIEESHSTLRFASRAKTIKNKPHVNEVLSDAALLKKYRNEIERLQKIVKNMGIENTQNTKEDLRKQLEEKQELIKHLTQQIVVSSSVADNSGLQKKKTRRETWCGSRVRRKSLFPQLPPVDHSQFIIPEETALELDLALSEDLSLTSISETLSDDSKASVFLRRSEQFAAPQSLFWEIGTEEDYLQGSDNKEQAEELTRLHDLIHMMEAEHLKEREELKEKIRQLEFEKAMEVDYQEEKQKNINSDLEQEIACLKEQMKHVQYEHDLLSEENKYFQKMLCQIEGENGQLTRDNERLTQEVHHLCDERFSISLQEWEEMEIIKVSLEMERKQIVTKLQEKEKEVRELQKMLASQEPYLARLEQQLEMYIGAGNGQFSKGKRRSGIPVPVKGENGECAKIEDDKPEVEPVKMSNCINSSEDQLLLAADQRTNGDVAVHAEDSHSSAVALENTKNTVICTTSFRDSQAELAAHVEDISSSPDISVEEELQASVSASVHEDVFDSSLVNETTTAQSQEEKGMRGSENFSLSVIAGSSVKSCAKHASLLKRRSDGVASLSGSADTELLSKLSLQDQELEYLSRDNARMLEMLNQANAEILRSKEAMKALEQTDLERLEELAEIPKLRALLNRREMQIHHLEKINEQLKEDLMQQTLNSSTSSLSSSFTEPRRKSVMLKEREAEVWKLKDMLIQQEIRLDDIQQEKLALEDMVISFKYQPSRSNCDESVLNQTSSLASSSSLSTADHSSIPAVADEEDVVDVEKEHQIVVSAKDLETVQNLLYDKATLISHLNAKLQEKEQELDQMFEGKMLVPNDMIQSHLEQAERQKEQIEILTKQLNTKEGELAMLKAKDQQRNSVSSSGEESSQGEVNSFQEQLIMDKMELEEELQKKLEELNQAMKLNKNLQIQLEERCQLVSELRQEEDMKAQGELGHFKQNSDKRNPQNLSSKPSADQTVTVPAVEVLLPSDYSCEINLKTTATQVDITADAVTEHALLLKDLQQREQHLLETLKHKEEQIHPLCKTLQSEQTETSVVASPRAEGLSGNSTEPNITSLQGHCEQLTELIQEANDTKEKNIILESEVGRLLAIVEEKVSKICQLEKLLKELGSPAETLSVNCTDSKVDFCAESEVLTDNCANTDKLELQAKNVENTEQLEISEDQNIASVETVQDHEVRPPELIVMDKDLKITIHQREKETVVQQKLEISAEVELLSHSQQIKCDSADQDILQSGKVVDRNMLQAESLAPEMQVEVEVLQSHIKQLLSSSNQSALQKNDLEKELKVLKDEVSFLRTQIQESEQIQALLTASSQQSEELQIKVQELTSKVEEYSSTIEQMHSDHEEVTAELNWQTKTCENIQSNVEELEAELARKNQELDELMQDLERAQKLQEDSEQYKLVVEETLQNYKTLNAQLKADREALVTERNDFEMKEETALKEQSRLKLELELTSERLQGQISILQQEVQTVLQQKEVNEAMLADKESAQHVGERLHQKLTADLQESRAEGTALKTALSDLKSELRNQELKYTELENIKFSLATGKDELVKIKVSLEAEGNELRKKLLCAQEEIAVLHQDLRDKDEDAEEIRKDFQSKVVASHEENCCLKSQLSQLTQQIDLHKVKLMKMQLERDKARTDCQHLTQQLQLLEARCSQTEQECQKMTDDVQNLQQVQKDLQLKVAASHEENHYLKSQLEQLGQQMELNSAKVMEMQLERDKARTDCQHLTQQLRLLEARCSQAEQQRQKMTDDVHTPQQDSSVRNGMVPLIEVKKQKFMLKNRIRELTKELESSNKTAKIQDAYITELIQKLEKYESEEQEHKDKKIGSLTKDLKSKELELVGLKMKQEEELRRLHKHLTQAEEMVAYKEQTVSNLKREIRRIRSEEVSFCTPAAPKPTVTSADPDERVISSHSGIIDRYTVTLLEADKYKLQKELKKTQDRLKTREAELHLAKVALAKAKTGDVITSSPTSLSSSLANSASLETNQSIDKAAQLHDSASAGGTSEDSKRQRPILPSAVDKENTPVGTDVLVINKSSATVTPDFKAAGDSPINIEPEFWKKPKRPVGSLYKPSSTYLLGKSAGVEADQCKTQ